MDVGKSDGPEPVLPTPGKVNVDFAPVEVVGVGWLVGNENVGTGVAAVLEVVVVDDGGLEKKLGTVVLVAAEGGSGFVVGAGEAVVAGLVKKFGTAG